MEFMTRETVDQDTADQVMNSFKILAGDKVNVICYYYVIVIIVSLCVCFLFFFCCCCFPLFLLAIHHCRWVAP